MATRTRAAKVVPAPDEKVSWVNSLGPKEYRVKLWRYSDTQPREWQYAGMMVLRGDLYEFVKGEFGGGAYRAALVDDSGKYLKGEHHSFSILGPPAKAPDGIAVLTGPVGKVAELEAKLLAMESKNKVGDVVAMVAGIVGALAPVGAGMVALVTSMNTGKKSEMGLGETLMLLETTREKGREQGKELGELVARRLGGGDEANANLVALARETMPKVLELMSEKRRRVRAARGEVEAAPVRALPAQSPPPPPEVPAMPAPPKGYEWVVPLRSQYPLLLTEAAEGSDAEVIATFVTEKMPDVYRDKMAACSQLSHFKGVMQNELAAIHAAHPEWLDTFLQAIIDGFHEGEDDEAEEP